MYQATVCVAVVVVGEQDALGGVGQAKCDDEVKKAREAPPVDHLVVFGHVDARVYGALFLGQRERQILGEPVFHDAFAQFGQCELLGQTKRLDEGAYDEWYGFGRNGDGESMGDSFEQQSVDDVLSL